MIRVCEVYVCLCVCIGCCRIILGGFQCVCMYACMHVMCVYVCVVIRVCIYVCVNIYVRVCILTCYPHLFAIKMTF